VDQQLIIRRRRIDPGDLDQIRRLIAQEGQRGRSHISNQLCDLWDWRQANGHFRQIACRDLLRRLEAKGLIELPAMMAGVRRPGYTKRVRTPELLDRTPLQGSIEMAGHHITLELVQGREQAQLFNGLIGTYHYLGYQPATGARLKYLARHKSQPIACLSFGSAAYKVAPRDQWIGWNRERRQERLSWLVNNDRFLVLPWVQVRGLASFLCKRPAEPCATSGRSGSFTGERTGGIERRSDSAAGTGRGALRREGFLPPPGRQLPDVFVGMTGQPLQDVVEVSVRFDPQPLARDHEGKEIGRLLSACFLADV
jgi:Domain of unknown function (DUF4338)